MRSRVILSILALTGFIRSVSAEEPRQVVDEYVISIGPSSHLRDKAEAVIESLDPTLATLDETTYTMLVGPEWLDESQGSEASEAVRRGNLCDRIRRLQRSQRQSRASRETNQIIRRIECSPNIIFQPASLPSSNGCYPNDPFLQYQWEFNGGGSVAQMNAGQAWCHATGSSRVVAVIDTGVDYNHPDLNANMWRNPGEVPGNGVDDDANGFVDDVYGINAITTSGDPMDDHGHGTHCAGTVGARGGNGVGVTGVMQQARVMAVKALGPNGGTLNDAVRAIDYVTTMKQRGVDVVVSNNSWGCEGCYSSAIVDAIQRAHNAGILFVAAAGNSSKNVDTTPFYPAGHSVPNVISVAAVDSAGNLASFSNYGASTVHLAAPGVQIASTMRNNSYVYQQGTSMAAPHVAGAVGLLAGHAPHLTAAQLRTAILSSVIQLPSLTGKTVTGGTLDLEYLVEDTTRWAPPPSPTPTPTTTPTPQPTRTPTPTATPTATPVPVLTDVRIQVVQPNGMPVAGAQVTLTHSGGISTAVTGTGGDVLIRNVLAPTDYTLTGSAAGHTFSSVAGRMQSGVTLTLVAVAQSYSVSGVIISPTEAPLSGVSVSAIAGGISYAAVVTSSEGRFSFQLPYGVEYSLSASDPRFIFPQGDLRGVVRGPVAHTWVGRR